MKNIMRVALPLIVLVGIVFGIAYVTQYANKGKSGKIDEPIDDNQPRAKVDPLRFNGLQAVWDPDDPVAIADVEIGKEAHYDFWFHNPNDVPVTIGLKKKSCTCAGIQIGRFTDANWSQWQKSKGTSGGWTLVRDWSKLIQSVAWEALLIGESEKRSVAPQGPHRRREILRVRWEAKQREEPVVQLTFEIAHEIGKQVVISEFSARYTVVPVLTIGPQQVELGDIPQGDKRSMECFAFSTTRDEFNIELKMGPDAADAANPCFELTNPVKLSRDELVVLPKTLGSQYERLRPKSGYKFTVTVWEVRGDRQLDLGPLSRRLDVSVAGVGNALSVPVHGIVRGEVEVLGADSRGRISLGSFKADREMTQSVTLMTRNKDYDLKIESITNSAIKASLTVEPEIEGKKRWRLTVTIPAYGLVGPIENTTAVVLSTRGSGSRLLRVPISGNAFR
jgi:hypothetical protein